MATILWSLGIIVSLLIAFFAWSLVRIGALSDDDSTYGAKEGAGREWWVE